MDFERFRRTSKESPKPVTEERRISDVAVGDLVLVDGKPQEVASKDEREPDVVKLTFTNGEFISVDVGDMVDFVPKP